MAVVINRTNWRPPAWRLYLWECGICHSKSLARYGEFCNYEFQCPVCGKITEEVDPDYISNGGIRSLHVIKSGIVDEDDYNNPIPTRTVHIMDYDWTSCTYSYRMDKHKELIEEIDKLDRWFNAYSEHTETEENKL